MHGIMEMVYYLRQDVIRSGVGSSVYKTEGRASMVAQDCIGPQTESEVRYW